MDWGTSIDCYQLHTLDIPESVSSIGALSFMLCSGLESVNLPSYLDSIPYGAFEYCTSLREIRMPETMDGAIDDVAFEGCYSLTSITVPEGTTEIGDQAFLYVPLDTIQFSDSVRKIGERAFVYTNLQGTLDLNQVEEIEQWAFVDLPSIDQIYAYNVTTIENDVFKLYNSEAIPTAIYTTPGGMLENPLYWETQNRIMSNLFAEPLTRPTEMYITRHVIGDAVNIQSIMDRGSDDVTKCYGEFSGDHARPSDAYDLASHKYTEVYFEHEICNLDNSLVPDITIAEII